MRNALARIAVTFGALSVAACSGQSVSIPGLGVHDATYATQTATLRSLSRQIGGVPAQSADTVLYSFATRSGANPTASLININGILYGTTRFGGPKNDGTVFKITTSGALTVLHDFVGGSDGAGPEAHLTDVNGVLYGTTEGGGDTNDDGTVFKITTSGTESVLHRFASSDGANPTAGLTNVSGVLYGTTFDGGTHRSGGTAFKITTSGALSVLHNFGDRGDGAQPRAGLTNDNGVLYGTTAYGGDANNNGTVFGIATSGAETILYRFEGGSDGSYPTAGLTNVNGVLYGTTFSGGAAGHDYGTVFKVTTSGTETVLHSFSGGSDGRGPLAGLTNVDGALYGTTYYGGVDYDTGTVFKITTPGAKSTVYSFKGGSDGAEPYAGLTNVNGVLYGTTYGGGANHEGTVFSLSL